MWDERERFARGFVKVLAWALLVVGVASVAASLALRAPAIFLAFLQFIGILACLVLVWALVMGGFMAAVCGLLSLFGRVAGWLSGRQGRDASLKELSCRTSNEAP